MNTYYITGTSRGLGKALAMELLNDHGNHVFGIGRSSTISHDHYRHLDLDLTNTEAAQDFRFVLPRGTKRAVLINNAGVVSPVAPVGRIDNQALVAGFQVNLISPAILMNNFIRDTHKRRAERLIINISSGAARHTIDSWAVYCAGKAGLDMFSNVLHSEQRIHYNRRPVFVFSIAPGVVDTEMQEQIRKVPKKDFAGKDRFVRMKRDGELAAPKDTATKILKIVEQPKRYPNVCLDVKELQSF